MKNVALFLAIAALAAGCSSTETKTDAPVTDRSATSQPTPSPSASTASRTTAQPAVAGNPLKDPSNILSKRSVFFDYDSNMVKDEYKNMVQAHSRYLGDKRDSKIRIEGNCDERGSREYNLALGQRPRRVGEEDDDRARRVRRPHRDHELRRREADGPGPRRAGLVAEPPRGHQVRR
jgi:peptidoglycan-associated lipoprotein